MSETNPIIKQPVNDENPVYLPLFVFQLSQWITTQDKRYRRFIEFGISTCKDRTVCWNVTHAIRHKHAKNVAPSSWAKPFQPFPAERLNETLTKEYGKEGALPTELEDADAKRFTIAEDILVELDAALFETISCCYPSAASRDALGNETQYSGLRLIAKLHSDCQMLGPEANAKLTELFEHTLKAGLAGPTIIAFHDHVSLVDAFNNAVVADARKSELSLLEHHKRVVRDLGDYPGIRLDIQLAKAETEWRASFEPPAPRPSAAASPPRRIVHRAILFVISEIEAKSTNVAKPRRALFARSDPERPEKGASGAAEGDANRGDPPYPCPEEGCGANHWLNECAIRKERLRKEQEQKEKDARQKARKEAKKALKAERKASRRAGQGAEENEVPADKPNKTKLARTPAAEAPRQTEGSDDEPVQHLSAGEVALASLFSEGGGTVFSNFTNGKESSSPPQAPPPAASRSRTLVARRGQAATAADKEHRELVVDFAAAGRAQEILDEQPVLYADAAAQSLGAGASGSAPSSSNVVVNLGADLAHLGCGPGCKHARASTPSSYVSPLTGPDAALESIGSCEFEPDSDADTASDTASDRNLPFHRRFEDDVEVAAIRERIQAAAARYALADTSATDASRVRVYLIMTSADAGPADDWNSLGMYGAGPGIYYGTWDEPDHLSRLVKGKSIVVPNCNAPSKNYKTNISLAIRAAERAGVHPILCGPRDYVDPDDGTLFRVGSYLGENLITPTPLLSLPSDSCAPAPAPAAVAAAVQQLDADSIEATSLNDRIRETAQAAVASMLQEYESKATDAAELKIALERAQLAERKVAELAAARAAERAQSEEQRLAARRSRSFCTISLFALGFLSLSVLAVAVFLGGSAAYDPGALLLSNTSSCSLPGPEDTPRAPVIEHIALLLSAALLVVQGNLLYRARRVSQRSTRWPRPWWWRYTTITAAHIIQSTVRLSAFVGSVLRRAPDNHFGRAASGAFVKSSRLCSPFWACFGLIHLCLSLGAAALGIENRKDLDLLAECSFALTPGGRASLHVSSVLATAALGTWWHRFVYGASTPPRYRLRKLKVLDMAAWLLRRVLDGYGVIRRVGSPLGPTPFECVVAIAVLFLQRSARYWSIRKEDREPPVAPRQVLPTASPRPCEKLSLNFDDTDRATAHRVYPPSPPSARPALPAARPSSPPLRSPPKPNPPPLPPAPEIRRAPRTPHVPDKPGRPALPTARPLSPPLRSPPKPAPPPPPPAPVIRQAPRAPEKPAPQPTPPAAAPRRTRRSRGRCSAPTPCTHSVAPTAPPPCRH